MLICSPYLYDEAIERYLGIMETAIKRGVEIIVYTLTPEHRSIRWKDKHRTLIKNLGGLVWRLRNVRMHEKAVIVLDGEDKMNVLLEKKYSICRS